MTALDGVLVMSIGATAPFIGVLLICLGAVALVALLEVANALLATRLGQGNFWRTMLAALMFWVFLALAGYAAMAIQ